MVIGSDACGGAFLPQTRFSCVCPVPQQDRLATDVGSLVQTLEPKDPASYSHILVKSENINTNTVTGHLFYRCLVMDLDFGFGFFALSYHSLIC